MRNVELLFGIMLLVLGGVALAATLLDLDVWRLFWPAALILLGLWILLGTLIGPGPRALEQVALRREGEHEARLRLSHGAGRLTLAAGAGPGELLAGSFDGGVEVDRRMDGERADVRLRPRVGTGLVLNLPWAWLRGIAWDVRLTCEIPLSLRIETGASQADIDLSDLKVQDFALSTGASDVRLRLPARAGATRGRVEAGAASVRVEIPDGVAARIRCSAALGEAQIDRQRFARREGMYVSEGYETAEHRVDLTVEVGAGSVRVA